MQNQPGTTRARISTLPPLRSGGVPPLDVRGTPGLISCGSLNSISLCPFLSAPYSSFVWACLLNYGRPEGGKPTVFMSSRERISRLLWIRQHEAQPIKS